jgi:hypothetical protein
MIDRSFCHKRARPNMAQEENSNAMTEAMKNLLGMGPAMSILLNEPRAIERGAQRATLGTNR